MRGSRSVQVALIGLRSARLAKRAFVVSGLPPSNGIAGSLISCACIYTRISSVRLTWDDAKSRANLVERGFDFAFAAAIFSEATIDRVDDRRDYGEVRHVAVGRAAGVGLTVVYTDRRGPDGTIERRIISARVSNRREKKAFEQAYPEL